MMESDCTCGTIFVALFTRIVFALHSFIGILTVLVQVGWFHYKVLLFTGLLGLCIETILTVYKRKGAEYSKW